jgi:2-succinyl-5-enolpyruvyl-6-hydroxy-3-cyclohexene-1-carboxylate synthase
VVAGADGILRSERFSAGHLPELVVRIGGPWASKVVISYLASAAARGAETVLIDPWWQWADPDRLAATVVRTGPALLCRAVSDRLVEMEGGGSGDRGWHQRWLDAESAAQRAIHVALGTGPDGWSEPGLARALVECMPDGANLMVSSSMPVRDVEAFGGTRRGHPRVLANRGANGIDGVVSTAIGVALSSAAPTVALVGDLAFLHDCSSLVGSRGTEVPCTVVVADNGGGGIFSFLAPADVLEPERFETLFGTPQAPDVAQVAAGFGIPVVDIGPGDGWEALTAAIRDGTTGDRLTVVRVRLPDRAENVAVHGRVNRKIVEAVDSLG